VAALFSLSPAATAALAPDASPAEFLEALILEAHWTDAVRFLAHALPKREAVWWAATCARMTLPADAPPEVAAALQAAEAWVFQPSEENRRAAMAKAEAATLTTAPSWAAVAAFWSGGSLGPVEAPPVPPAETLYAAAVTGAVILAAVYAEPQFAPQKYRRFLDAGVDIARGGSGRAQQPQSPAAS
jgi:hypothetical protein